jgi:hypothetical protein
MMLRGVAPRRRMCACFVFIHKSVWFPLKHARHRLVRATNTLCPSHLFPSLINVASNTVTQSAVELDSDANVSLSKAQLPSPQIWIVQFEKGMERWTPDYEYFSKEFFFAKQSHIDLDVSLFGIINSLPETNHTTCITLQSAGIISILWRNIHQTEKYSK